MHMMDRYVVRAPSWKTTSYQMTVASAVQKKTVNVDKGKRRLYNLSTAAAAAAIVVPSTVAVTAASAVGALIRSPFRESTSANINNTCDMQFGKVNASNRTAQVQKTATRSVSGSCERIQHFLPDENTNHECILETPLALSAVQSVAPRGGGSATNAWLTAEPQTPKKNRILEQVRRDLNSPSASLRLRAINALKNPKVPPEYNVFDITNEEEDSGRPAGPQTTQLPTINEILSSVIVYVEVRSGEDNRSDGVKKVIAALGARIANSVSRNTTHVIFKDGRLSTYKRARALEIPIVSILWIEACKKERRLCDPAEYPISNIDRYDYPELYEKQKRHKNMQPDSECNKRVRTKPTDSNDQVTKASSQKTTPKNSQQKSNLTHFFKRIEVSGAVAVSVSTSTTGLDSPATVYLNRISSMDVTPLRSTSSENCPSIDHVELDASQTGIPLGTIQITEQSADYAPASAPMTRLRRRNSEVALQNPLTPSKINNPIADKQKNRRRTLFPLTVSLDLIEEVAPKDLTALANRRCTLKPTSSNENLIEETMSSEMISGVPNFYHTPLENIECSGGSKRSRSTNKRFTVLPSASKEGLISDPITEEASDQTTSTSSGMLEHDEHQQISHSSNNHSIDFIERAAIEAEPCIMPGRNTPSSSNARNRRTLLPTASMGSLFSQPITEEVKDLDNAITTPSSITLRPDRHDCANNTNGTQADVEHVNEEHTSEIPKKQKNKEAANKWREIFVANKAKNSKVSRDVTIYDLEAIEITDSTADIVESSRPASATPPPEVVSRYEMESIDVSNLNPTIETQPPERSVKRQTLYTPHYMELTAIKENYDNRSNIAQVSSAERNPEISYNSTTAGRGIIQSIVEEELKSPLFSSTRLPTANGRRTLYDNSMEVIEQRLRDINDVSRRRSMAVPTEDPPIAMIGEPAASQSIINKAKTTPIPAGKRRLYVPNAEGVLMATPKSLQKKSSTSRRRTLEPAVAATTLPPKNAIKPTQRLSRRSTMDFEQSRAATGIASQNRKTVMQKRPIESTANDACSGSQKPAAKRRPLPSLVYTNMQHDQINVIRETLKKLRGFRLEFVVNDRTTHVVSMEPKRTLNMLRGLMHGAWILDYTWIADSLRFGKWLPEEQYEMRQFSRAVEICRVERQALGVHYRCELFRQLEPIYVSSRCKQISAINLRELLRLGNATVADDRRQAKYVIGEQQKGGEQIFLSPQWVLDSIRAMSLLKLNKYILNSNAISGDGY